MRLISLLTLAVSLIACSSSHDASAAGDVSESESPDLARAIARSRVLEDAQALIDSGHPWRATQSLAASLRDASKRTPATVLLSARAAAGWDGWAEVDKLLARESWVDSLFDGEGRELLTRSALERSADTTALKHAELALRAARTNQERAVRRVLFARALERNNFFDSAATSYARAADELRPARDWLLLRVAGNTMDSTKRGDVLRKVTLASAKPRVAWTDAQARERFGDVLGAAARFASLGATVTALRLRLSVAPDSGLRDTIKNELLAYVRAHSGTADSKTAVDVLDKAFTSFTPGEELVIARSAAVSGPTTRAIAAFERALSQPGLITPTDRIAYAQVLARANRANDAYAQLNAVQGPLAGQAQYQRARIQLTAASASTTRATLRDVAARFATDTNAAPPALYLLADLTIDDGNDAGARALYERLYKTYPMNSRADDSRFRAAVLTLVSGDARGAAQQFDSLVALYPRSDEATAARYWSGRSWAQAGNATTAETRWREILAQQPTSYYAVTSAARLRASPFVPPARADSFPRVASVDSAVARIELLQHLGMDAEARFEMDALDEHASSPDRVLASARAFLMLGQPSRTIRLGQKLIDGGQRDARAFRLAYPLVDGDELAREANARGLDPALVAGLIRQESNFTARAISPANARGLMQVLPSVGEAIARSLNYPVWYPVLLLDPDANLQLGTAHLATYFKQYGPEQRVLAAYNAGGSRVTRWVNKPGADDPEMFVERIPYVETRDYVRLVQRNRAMYQQLYHW